MSLVAVVTGLVAIPLVVLGLVFWAPTPDPERGPVAQPEAAPQSDAQSDPQSEAAPPLVVEPEASSPAESTPAPRKARIRRALYFGDSLFIGGGYTTEQNSMARISANRLKLSRAWINGGGGTGYVTANPEYGLGTYLEQIAAGAFDVPPVGVVVIEGGNNDRGYPVKDIRRYAGKVIRAAQRWHPQAKVIVLGPIDNNADHSELAPIMRAVRKAARNNDVPFVNGLRWLEGRYYLTGPDFDHPVPEGHRILGRKLAKALRARGVGARAGA